MVGTFSLGSWNGHWLSCRIVQAPLLVPTVWISDGNSDDSTSHAGTGSTAAIPQINMAKWWNVPQVCAWFATWTSDTTRYRMRKGGEFLSNFYSEVLGRSTPLMPWNLPFFVLNWQFFQMVIACNRSRWSWCSTSRLERGHRSDSVFSAGGYWGSIVTKSTVLVIECKNFFNIIWILFFSFVLYFFIFFSSCFIKKTWQLEDGLYNVIPPR